MNGKAQRPKPKRLAEKLSQIRLNLGLSQTELIGRLNFDELELVQGTIFTYELGKREPSLPLLLAYARLAKISIIVGCRMVDLTIAVGFCPAHQFRDDAAAQNRHQKANGG